METTSTPANAKEQFANSVTAFFNVGNKHYTYRGKPLTQHPLYEAAVEYSIKEIEDYGHYWFYDRSDDLAGKISAYLDSVDVSLWTNLDRTINTVDDVKAFIKDLWFYDELWHWDENPHDTVWNFKEPTQDELAKLKALQDATWEIMPDVWKYIGEVCNL